MIEHAHLSPTLFGENHHLLHLQGARLISASPPEQLDALRELRQMCSGEVPLRSWATLRPFKLNIHLLTFRYYFHLLL